MVLTENQIIYSIDEIWRPRQSGGRAINTVVTNVGSIMLFGLTTTKDERETQEFQMNAHIEFKFEIRCKINGGHF